MNLQLERYTVKRLLGQGAMGRVYLAEDPKLSRQVAIKVLTVGAGEPELRRRFRLEAKAIAALKHPNIVELYDYSGEDAADLYLVMEYVPGPSLYHLITHRGPMSETTALCVGHELALALEHAHAHQVVHRDLKPENVLLHQGRVVLTDFGVVKAIASDNPLGVQADRTRTQVLGTPGFMAPEQFVGRRIGPHTDLFALGAVLYNLCTGRLPFEGETVDQAYARLQKGKLVDPRQHNPLLSQLFCDLVAGCLALKPRARPASATAVRGHILELLAVHGVSEVRQELVDYDRNPTGYAAEQRERRLDVLVRDLKVALKDRDLPRARELIDRMRVLAPPADLVRDITGVSFDAKHRPVFGAGRGRRWAIGARAAFVLGALAGVALFAALEVSGLVPVGWWAGVAAYLAAQLR